MAGALRSRASCQWHGWSVGDVGGVEINEAFAAIALACLPEIGGAEDVVNIDGGAIAHGHRAGGRGGVTMKTLPIVWQRLVTEGETCQRCGSTQQNVLSAMAKLDAALCPLGIEPTLETREIDDAAFRDDPSQSNRIWIAGKPIEHWLGATAGESPCCSVCGDLPCRTLHIDGDTYETVPEALIVSAAMMAAAQMTAPTRPAGTTRSCCSAPGKTPCCG